MPAVDAILARRRGRVTYLRTSPELNRPEGGTAVPQTRNCCISCKRRPRLHLRISVSGRIVLARLRERRGLPPLAGADPGGPTQASTPARYSATLGLEGSP